MAKTHRERGTGSYDKVADAKGNVLFRWRIGIFNPIDGKTQYNLSKQKVALRLTRKWLRGKRKTLSTERCLRFQSV